MGIKNQRKKSLEAKGRSRREEQSCLSCVPVHSVKFINLGLTNSLALVVASLKMEEPDSDSSLQVDRLPFFLIIAITKKKTKKKPRWHNAISRHHGDTLPGICQALHY